VSSVKQEVEFAAVEIRPMHDLDVPVIVAIERAAYQFPWSEGIFRDCLRVGYVCRVVDIGGDMAGYGIMSVGAGEAHILNVCIAEEYRGRGFAYVRYESIKAYCAIAVEICCRNAFGAGTDAKAGLRRRVIPHIGYVWITPGVAAIDAKIDARPGEVRYPRRDE